MIRRLQKCTDADDTAERSAESRAEMEKMLQMLQEDVAPLMADEKFTSIQFMLRLCAWRTNRNMKWRAMN